MVSKTQHEQRLAAIRVSVVIQAFCPAQTSVLLDRKVALNPLLNIVYTISPKFPLRHIAGRDLRQKQSEHFLIGSVSVSGRAFFPSESQKIPLSHMA